MKKAAVFTNDDYLFNKIRLSLLGEAVAVRAVTEHDCEGCSAVFVDADGCELEIEGAVTMSRRAPSELPIPFHKDAPRAFLGERGEGSLVLDGKSKTVLVRGERVKLTSLEYELLSLLKRRGGFVSKEEILREVWDGSADAGIVNVYVHYLREKLERSGEKVIVSMRNRGYGISEKFLIPAPDGEV